MDPKDELWLAHMPSIQAAAPRPGNRAQVPCPSLRVGVWPVVDSTARGWGGVDPLSKGNEGRALEKGAGNNQHRLCSISRCSLLVNDRSRDYPRVSL